MIPQEYIQEVVRRNDIEEVIGQYVQLRRRGRTATGLCPFHNEKRRPSSFTRIPRAFTASAAVRRAMSSTLCASTTISAMSRLSSSWRAAPVCRCPRRMTASPVRASACWRSTAAPPRYFYENLNAKTPEAAMARRYWKEKRGLSDAAIRRFGLGYAPEDFGGLLHYLKRRGFQ